MNRENLRTTGSRYEQKAAACLSQMGFRLLDRNFRCRQGEIDLIAMDGETLVFIEVKYRSSLKNGDPAEAVNKRKQRRIIQAARYYMLSRGFSEDTPCRFDVAALWREEGTDGTRFRLIRDAFWGE